MKISTMHWLGMCLFLTGCAGGEVPDENLPYDQRLAKMGYQQMEPVKEVRTHLISGWQPVDEHHMVLDAGPGRGFLVEFSRPCRSLKFGSRIAYSTTLGRLTRLDRIMVSDTPSFPEACLIEELYRLERIKKG